MKTSLLKTLSATFVALLLLIGAMGCGGEHSVDDAHEHGPNTHTHETPATLADTAGTYVDTTSVGLDDHEHGPDTHTHDDDVPAHE